MSIFGTIMAKVFHHESATAGTAGGAPASAGGTPSPTSSEPTLGSPTSANTAADATQRAQNDNSAVAPRSAGSAQSVDVAALLNGLAAKNSEKLDWQHSIVDMMKLLGLDSSLTSRQELAKELSYTGDMHDSATMNVWLHKQVMQKLAANGGTVPDDLKV